MPRIDQILENPGNPLGWTIRMFRVWGIDARIHLVTLIYFASEILGSLPRTNTGVVFMVGYMASLFVIVLLHEFGHCFACRWAGGQSNRIVMLPFGGLAFTMPPDDWRAHLITTVGGPAVNVALAALSALALAAMGYSGNIFFHPFNPGLSMPTQAVGPVPLLAVVVVWQFHVVNIIILGFNVLLPFFPLDGGRIVQELLWAKLGFRRSMQIATTIGLVGAIGVSVFALVTNQMMLLWIAVFGLWACWTERQRVRFAGAFEGAPSGLGPAGSAEGPVPHRGPSKAELRQRDQERADAAELDRILAKIADHGMQSLTGGEKRTLERVRKKKARSGSA